MKKVLFIDRDGTLAIEWKKERGLRVTVDGSREYVCAANSGEIRIEIEL